MTFIERVVRNLEEMGDAQYQAHQGRVLLAREINLWIGRLGRRCRRRINLLIWKFERQKNPWI